MTWLRPVSSIAITRSGRRMAIFRHRMRSHQVMFPQQQPVPYNHDFGSA
jgi:hypothetical protein